MDNESYEVSLSEKEDGEANPETKVQDPVAAQIAHVPQGLSKIELLHKLKPILLEILDNEPYFEAALEVAKDRFGLKTDEIRAWRSWAKEERKRRRGKKAGEEDIDQLKESGILHPAIDFAEGNILLGFRLRSVSGANVKENKIHLHQTNERDWQIAVDRQVVVIGEKKYVLDPKGCPPWLQNRWSLEKIREFKDNPWAPSGCSLFDELVEALWIYLDLASVGVYFLLAAWAIGTYLAHKFPAFPFLLLLGPKETGKSRTLELLSHACFNALKLKGVTVPALGDTIEGMRGTVLLDQAERLRDDLVGTLADSYKRVGGKRRVIEIVNGVRSVREFSTYGPKAFATTKKVDDDLLDRCCKIGMVRTTKKLPDLEGWEPRWADLRDKIYRWVLVNHETVFRAFQEVPGNGTRWGELWRPLEAILSGLGVPEQVVAETRKVFRTGTQETQTALTDMEETLFLVLLEIIKDRPEGQMTEVSADELERGMKEQAEENTHMPSDARKWIGEQIAKYSLSDKRGRKSIRGRKVRTYSFNPARVKDILGRYLPDAGKDVSACPGKEKTNASDGLDRTHGDQADMSGSVHQGGSTIGSQAS